MPEEAEFVAVSGYAILLLPLALAIEAASGDFTWMLGPAHHPVGLLGRLIGAFDRRLNRPQRGERDRLVRGIVVVVLIVALAAVVGWALHWLSRGLAYGFVLELVCVVALLCQRSLYRHVRAVALGLERDGTAGGRRAVAHIVGRDPKTLDSPGIARAAIESAAENFGDGVVAPAFWYALLGLPGLFAYKAVNTLDSMIGHRTEQYRAFGMAAARLDDALSYLPARLAALLLAAAALFVPTGRPGAALRVMLRDARKHRSMNAGWPEAAAAGALHLALAGPRHYAGESVAGAWLGDGPTAAGARDVRRMLSLFTVACLLHGLVYILLALLWLGVE
jgi:adenosylcobinamide-phosphate synthase